MTRPIIIAMAAVAALATAPSLAASPLTWEQEARKYAPYAFGNPIALTDAVETGSIESFADYIPYYIPWMTSAGDPSGRTGSTPVDYAQTGQASAEASLDYYHYYTGYVSSVGDASAQSVDDTKTGGIGSAEPRVDVEGFCEGEGKLLAERHYVGFCHLAP